MAAADDRSGVTPVQKRPPAFSWLGLVGLGLLVALLSVALVQARQFSLLKQAVRASDDFALLNIYQVEIEYLRLRELWRMASATQLETAPPDLRLRYDIWVSRVHLLDAGGAKRLISDNADHQGTVLEIHRFIAAADQGLGAQPSIQATAAFLLDRLPSLDALGAPVHNLSLGAAHRLAEMVEERNQAVQQQNQLGLALTVFMSVLTLAFAYIALNQVGKLRRRRVVLEDLAQSLQLARGEAESASQAKSAFLANMSHEIRTPFHGLMGMLSLLRETGLTARQIDYLRTATESADHLLMILNDILDMSQLESGRLSLVPGPVAIRALLREVEALMRPQASAKSLALHMDVEPSVPERVMADATRVKQILFNLLSNAIKFSDRGAVLLHVTARSATTQQAQLEFAVIDTGQGLDEASLERLFNRFEQGDVSRSRRHAGTGLGLEISRNLARLMDGDIHVTSRPGEGSSFTLSMPLKPVVDVPVQLTPKGDATTRVGRPLQILVAEDHPVNRQYIATLLDTLGHFSHFALDGKEAVQAASTMSFDLILMDVHMPHLDGIGATRAIRALHDVARSTVPIVAMTADAFDETRQRCMVAGMNDFLTKPVSPQKLGTVLRQLFGSRPPAGTSPPPRATAEPPPPRPAIQHDPVPLLDEAAVASALTTMSRAELGSMMRALLDQGPATVQHMRAAVRDGQPLELRVNAHAAKGAALNLGFTALAQTAQSLQEGAAHLPAHEVARLVQRYEDLLGQTRQAAMHAALLPADNR